MKFFLGTHKAVWLSRTDVPLFVSRRTLQGRRSQPKSVGSWSLDSGGFTELSMHGRWTVSPQQYVDDVALYAEQIGNLAWAAPQDWMCEPMMIANTGKSVAEHLDLTVQNYLDLGALAPTLPIIPVIQGWELDDYLACVDLYRSAGVDLTALDTVGIGSVCRRQHADEIGHIVSTISTLDIRLHGFGVKTRGLGLYGQHLRSADSMAWSFAARFEPPMPGHTHKACNNCMEYALRWREQMLSRLTES